MKKSLQYVFLLVTAVVLLPAFIATEAGPAAKVKFPKKVNAVIQSKCYGCHSAEGKSDKAKKKLMWDDLAGLPAAEQLEKMKSIQGVLGEGSMPPSRFVENNPDKKLTDAEVALMKKWADKTVGKLSK